jgi:hypothetical protein
MDRALKIPWAEFEAVLENETDLGNPTRFDVALVEAIMLWSDEEGRRVRAALASFVEFASDNTTDLPNDVLRNLQQLTRMADPIETIQHEAEKERIIRGFLVGSVLHNIAALTALGVEKRSKQHVIEESISGFVKARRGFSVQHFHNEIWRDFKSVAHFWAATFKHVRIERKGATPCQLRDFREFLADAEAYRLKGEAIRQPHSIATVLKPGEAWQLPARLYAAPSELVFNHP